MKVRVLGPNLSAEAQRRGAFHVHHDECGDVRQYGRGRRFGGEDRGWTIEARSKEEVVRHVYADQIEEAGEDVDWQDFDDLHVAPCVKWDQ